MEFEIKFLMENLILENGIGYVKITKKETARIMDDSQR